MNSLTGINPNPYQELPNMQRKSIKTLLIHDHSNLHKALEDSHLPKSLKAETAKKEEYIQYLIYLKRDIKQLERLIQEHQGEPLMNIIDLKGLSRTDALEKDLTLLNLPHVMCKLTVEHGDHFQELANSQPFLLYPHLLIHLIGYLFGGQKLMTHLQRMWQDKAPIHLYTFDRPVNEIRSQIFAQLENLKEKLSDKEYDLLIKEFELAWCFAGDTLGVDIRHVI